MARKESRGRARTTGVQAGKRAVKKGSKLKDLDAKRAGEIRGGALETYVYVQGQKSGDIKKS